MLQIRDEMFLLSKIASVNWWKVLENVVCTTFGSDCTRKPVQECAAQSLKQIHTPLCPTAQTDLTHAYWLSSHPAEVSHSHPLGGSWSGKGDLGARCVKESTYFSWVMNYGTHKHIQTKTSQGRTGRESYYCAFFLVQAGNRWWRGSDKELMQSMSLWWKTHKVCYWKRSIFYYHLSLSPLLAGKTDMILNLKLIKSPSVFSQICWTLLDYIRKNFLLSFTSPPNRIPSVDTLVLTSESSSNLEQGLSDTQIYEP